VNGLRKLPNPFPQGLNPNYGRAFDAGAKAPTPKEQDLSTSSEAVRPQESFMGPPLAYYAAQEK
jgi:hypothetical protein